MYNNMNVTLKTNQMTDDKENSKPKLKVMQIRWTHTHTHTHTKDKYTARRGLYNSAL